MKFKTMGMLFTLLLSIGISNTLAQEPRPHPKGEVRDTVGLISEEVAIQRLKMQGYTNVQIQRKDQSIMEISAIKDNTPVFLEMHTKHGTIRDVTEQRFKHRGADSEHHEVVPSEK